MTRKIINTALTLAALPIVVAIVIVSWALEQTEL